MLDSKNSKHTILKFILFILNMTFPSFLVIFQYKR